MHVANLVVLDNVCADASPDDTGCSPDHNLIGSV